MPRDYYPTGGKSQTELHNMPMDIYAMSLGLIRGYDRMLKELADIIDQKPKEDGQPKAKRPGDPVGTIVSRRENLRDRIKAVEQAYILVDEPYRAGIKSNIVDRVPLKDLPNADISTWKVWRQRMILYTAQNMGWWW